MNEPSVNTLEQRMNRLERENRWWRALGCVGILGAVTLVLMGQARPTRVVEAEKFVLRDSDGNVRATLGEQPYLVGGVGLIFYDKKGSIRANLAMGPDGATSLVLYPDMTVPKTTTMLSINDNGMNIGSQTSDETGVVTPGGPTISLGVTDGAPAILLLGKDQKTSATLGVASDPDGTTYLSLRDNRGTTRVFLSLNAKGPNLILADNNEKPRMGLGLSANGTPGLSLQDGGGETRAWLNVNADGSPGLSLLDSNGKMRIGLSVLPEDWPDLSLYDSNKKPRIGLRVRADGSPGLSLLDSNEKLRAILSMFPSGRTGLVVFDPEENVIFKAP